MEWSGNYAPEGAEFLYLDTVLLFVMYTTIINKIQNTNTTIIRSTSNSFRYSAKLKKSMLFIRHCLTSDNQNCYRVNLKHLLE